MPEAKQPISGRAKGSDSGRSDSPGCPYALWEIRRTQTSLHKPEIDKGLEGEPDSRQGTLTERGSAFLGKSLCD